MLSSDAQGRQGHNDPIDRSTRSHARSATRAHTSPPSKAPPIRQAAATEASKTERCIALLSETSNAAKYIQTLKTPPRIAPIANRTRNSRRAFLSRYSCGVRAKFFKWWAFRYDNARSANQDPFLFLEW